MLNRWELTDPLPETHMFALENWCLEDDVFPFSGTDAIISRCVPLLVPWRRYALENDHDNAKTQRFGDAIHQSLQNGVFPTN